MDTVETISIWHLAIAFVPVVFVVALLHVWSKEGVQSLHGLARMLLQLLVIGYFLTYLFAAESGWIVLTVLTVMALAASWIALRTSPNNRRALYGAALLSIALGGGVTLVVVTQGVLALDPWHAPKYMIPLAGMIFGGSMTAISLATERFETELKGGASYTKARGTAFKTALIPITNSLFAVGLVSLPGMMTGQILSGVSPLIAVRYQIMVMCMMFAAAGLSTACFLVLRKNESSG